MSVRSSPKRVCPQGQCGLNDTIETFLEDLMRLLLLWTPEFRRFSAGLADFRHLDDCGRTITRHRSGGREVGKSSVACGKLLRKNCDFVNGLVAPRAQGVGVAAAHRTTFDAGMV